MREFLAIIITFGAGFFLTTALGYAFERHQRANTHVEMEADVRGGFVSLSTSGFVLKVLRDTPQTAELPAAYKRNDI